VAHILPHWTWPGREGEITPVHVYTSGDEAELFVNGKSMGRKTKEGYRIVWDDVVYQPGKIEVIAYKDGREWARDSRQTAGKAAKAVASIDYAGGDLIYVTVDIQDRRGTLVPDADNVVEFSLKGPGIILATDAGDPTSHVPFYSHKLPAFHGKASVIVKRTGSGTISVNANSHGLRKATCEIFQTNPHR
jgi:beta-galactosidase